MLILLLPVLYNYIPVAKKASTTFYIPSSSIKDVIQTLKKNGYTVTIIDKLMLQFIHIPQKGWYHVDHHEYGRLLFFGNMYNKKAATMDIFIYAGETADEIITRLANDMKLDKQKLQQTYQNLTRFQEADIFAKRYTIARKADEKNTIQYLFDQSNEELSRFKKKNFSQEPDISTIKILLTIASIIQKESNSVKEMPIISSVIYNRLDKDMKLQMDGTLNYGKNSHTIITPERIKTDTSYYNTYKYKGLPPTPLGSVTRKALFAAMHPAKSDYLFFMLKPDGSHTFAATYKEHLENIKAFRTYQKEKKQAKKEKKKTQETTKIKKTKTKKTKTKKKKTKSQKENNSTGTTKHNKPPSKKL
jgi:UPF0755 protein